jgi:hypothetical protein
MISHPRIPSCIQQERTRIRSEPVETTLAFLFSPAKRLCHYGGNAASISVVSFRAQREILDPSRSLGMTTPCLSRRDTSQEGVGSGAEHYAIEGISDRGCDSVLVFCAVPDFFGLIS